MKCQTLRTMEVMGRAVMLGIMAAAWVWLATPALAQEPGEGQGPFSVTPLVISEKGKPRDIIKSALTLTNLTNQRVDVYVAVRDFDPAVGERSAPVASSSAVAAESLARWIEITRGVITLEPRESLQVPYLVHINLRAKPGRYYATLVFGAGASRKNAFSEGAHTVRALMAVEVADDAVARLQLDTFAPESPVFSGDTATFTFALKNVGNRAVVPRGEIRIYNRRGQEVASLPANSAAQALLPSGMQQWAAVWDAQGRFGKYKALLDLSYGQAGTVQDTIYFWVFPWKEVLVGIALLLILIISTTYVLHLRATYAVGTPQEAPGAVPREETAVPPATAPLSGTVARSSAPAARDAATGGRRGEARRRSACASAMQREKSYVVQVPKKKT